MRTIYSALVALFTILGFSEPVSGQNDSHTYRLVIKVMSGDRNEPVEGATIWITATFDPKFEGIRRRETTMEDGSAYRQFEFAGTYTLKVSHPDFKDEVQTVTVKPGTPSGDVPVTFRMTRRSELKVVEINVVEEGNRFPIYDAKIILDGRIGYYTAATDSSGRAVINVDQSDTYKVSIKHTGYEPIATSVRVKGYDDEQKQVTLSVEMTPTKESAARTLRVMVHEKTASGVRPSMAAGVHLPDGQIKITGRDGSVELTHRYPPGEAVKVEVEKNGYTTAYGTFTVGVRGSARGQKAASIPSRSPSSRKPRGVLPAPGAPLGAT